ncbi:hypothetical protein SANTM175S_01009 [Streptomyces antimycoticus]
MAKPVTDFAAGLSPVAAPEPAAAPSPGPRPGNGGDGEGKGHPPCPTRDRIGDQHCTQPATRALLPG